MNKRIPFLLLMLAIAACSNDLEVSKQAEDICFYGKITIGDKFDSCYDTLDSISINGTKIMYFVANDKCSSYPPYILVMRRDNSIYYMEETMTQIKNYSSDFSSETGSFFDNQIVDHSEFDRYHHFVNCLEAYLKKGRDQELEYIIPFVFKGNVERICVLEDCRFASIIIDALGEKPTNCVFVVTTHMGNYKILFHWHERDSSLQSKIIISDSLTWELQLPEMLTGNIFEGRQNSSKKPGKTKS